MGKCQLVVHLTADGPESSFSPNPTYIVQSLRALSAFGFLDLKTTKRSVQRNRDQLLSPIFFRIYLRPFS